ncbi:unnamed protein product [Trichobilharzia regenti]|nr:unnamed protein product [Trichobilharzia regenti]
MSSILRILTLFIHYSISLIAISFIIPITTGSIKQKCCLDKNNICKYPKVWFTNYTNDNPLCDFIIQDTTALKTELIPIRIEDPDEMAGNYYSLLLIGANMLTDDEKIKSRQKYFLIMSTININLSCLTDTKECFIPMTLKFHLPDCSSQRDSDYAELYLLLIEQIDKISSRQEKILHPYTEPKNRWVEWNPFRAYNMFVNSAKPIRANRYILSYCNTNLNDILFTPMDNIHLIDNKCWYDTAGSNYMITDVTVTFSNLHIYPKDVQGVLDSCLIYEIYTYDKPIYHIKSYDMYKECSFNTTQWVQDIIDTGVDKISGVRITHENFSIILNKYANKWFAKLQLEAMVLRNIESAMANYQSTENRGTTSTTTVPAPDINNNKDKESDESRAFALFNKYTPFCLAFRQQYKHTLKVLAITQAYNELLKMLHVDWTPELGTYLPHLDKEEGGEGSQKIITP